MKRRLMWPAVLAVLAGTGLLCATACGGPPSASGALSARLLSVSDLPAGWSQTPVNNSAVQSSSPCFPSTSTSPAGWTHADVAFVAGSATPSLSEVLATGPQPGQIWQRLNATLGGCHSATLSVAGSKAAVSIAPLSFPRVGEASAAYAWTFTVAGMPFSVDLVAFRTGTYVGYIAYSGLGAPAVPTVRAFTDAAVAKATSGSTSPVPDSVSITSEPVRTVATSLGSVVAYRSIGNGPPLVLIMGFGGTMQTWDPRFVDALATHYRVIIFDNAGIGSTSALSGTLSIDAMADQTSALISALGLGRPDVLGWSMGTMIAEALAVRHPDQVNRLVLAASYPGDGSAVQPAQSAINTLKSSNALSVLFPADQGAAKDEYVTATSSYPAAAPAPSAVTSAQSQAIIAWWDGHDAAGQRAGSITAPTLIADGTDDQLDPIANSRNLAGQIAGAKLVLYPDAGHAFLFQDEAAFVPVVESFLAGGAGV